MGLLTISQIPLTIFVKNLHRRYLLKTSIVNTRLGPKCTWKLIVDVFFEFDLGTTNTFAAFQNIYDEALAKLVNCP